MWLTKAFKIINQVGKEQTVIFKMMGNQDKQYEKET